LTFAASFCIIAEISTQRSCNCFFSRDLMSIPQWRDWSRAIRLNCPSTTMSAVENDPARVFSKTTNSSRKLLAGIRLRDWNALASCLNIESNATGGGIITLQMDRSFVDCMARPSVPKMCLERDKFPWSIRMTESAATPSRSEVHGKNFRHRAVHILHFQSGRRGVLAATLPVGKIGIH